MKVSSGTVCSAFRLNDQRGELNAGLPEQSISNSDSGVPLTVCVIGA